MATPSRTARRLALAVLLAAVIPLVAAIYIARSMVASMSSQLYNPRVGNELERSLELYQELAKAKKDGMRYEAASIAARESLRAVAIINFVPGIREELDEVFPQYENLVLLAVADADGNVIAQRARQKPVDDALELRLEVRKPLSGKEDGPVLLAIFVTPKERFDHLEQASETVRLYRQIEGSRGKVERWHLLAFALLLALTMLGAVVVGTTLARGVTRRIDRLAKAAQAVGAGDLTVRVPVSGNDEIMNLSKAFNSMLREVERSRARIEFLQRMGTWQEIARRLAHEIKNPLTPIQLAVEEAHARYQGDDPKFQALLEITLKIVQEEVATLRRLVTEFSAFARLPRAELAPGDLAAFLQEQRKQMALFSDDESGIQATDADQLEGMVDVVWEIPSDPVFVHFDRQMMHRVLINLVRNAAQAVRDLHRGTTGRLRVAVATPDPDWIHLEIDDDGPGIREDLRETVFDPYVTTKHDGTGLGLSIVKKIIMEHGGTIEASSSPWGGARMLIRLPRSGTEASIAARENVLTTGPISTRKLLLRAG